MQRPVSGKVIYVGLFLSPGSKAALLEAFPPRHATVHASHVTLIFKPTDEELQTFMLGESVQMNISMKDVFDDKGQAVLVIGMEKGFKSKNPHPHITISTAPGVKPVYSNELIAKTTSEPAINDYMRLTGVVATFPSQLVNAKENQNG